MRNTEESRRLRLACLLALIACLLTACTTVQPEGYSLSATVRDCLSKQPRFVDAWGCVQARYASGQMGENPDRRVAAFLKLGDDLAGQVAARSLPDRTAKERLTAGSADLDKM